MNASLVVGSFMLSCKSKDKEPNKFGQPKKYRIRNASWGYDLIKLNRFKIIEEEPEGDDHVFRGQRAQFLLQYREFFLRAIWIA